MTDYLDIARRALESFSPPEQPSWPYWPEPEVWTPGLDLKHLRVEGQAIPQELLDKRWIWEEGQATALKARHLKAIEDEIARQMTGLSVDENWPYWVC